MLSRNGRRSSISTTTRDLSRASITASLPYFAPRSKGRSGVHDGIDDPVGPLGLTTVYYPSEPLVDLVFVHGLGGGSRKTWSYSTSISHFWPQEWLPQDDMFKHVRIHTFGYESNWAKGNSNLWSIHEFGKLLLGEMSTLPDLIEHDTPIILVGHSMGGLVIKKAYILAREDTSHRLLADRFHTMFFLATPHRGSNKANILSRVLHAAYNSQAYVADLGRGSDATQSINDSFRHYSGDVAIWSFYETQKLNLKVFNTLIVEKDSATLGYREEKQIPVNADHRSICKFDSPNSPNYRLLRNAIASTISEIVNLRLSTSKSNTALTNLPIEHSTEDSLRRSQINDLRTLLGVSKTPEDDLIVTEDARIPGSCGWLSTRQSYLKWKDFSAIAPRLFWLNGKPAAGKSILAGYVIDELKATEPCCSYFFFKYGDKSKSSLSACLRSIAFQMAVSNLQVREKLSDMQKEDAELDMDDHGMIWRKVFLSRIFQIDLPSQYWVIDALDECDNFSSLFATKLAKLSGSVPIRIFITSRDSPEIEKLFIALGSDQFHSERVSEVDTLADIRLLVEKKADSLGVRHVDGRTALVEKILNKSNGNFLWTVLVLNELLDADNEDEINQVLEDVPREMGPLYKRILEAMSQATRGKKLAQAVLVWATCTVRPLTIEELNGALKMDINSDFPNLEDSINARCGQLVYIDKFDKVQMVHETAREVLLNDNLESEFAVRKSDAHTQIAKACLVCLTQEDMRPPRTRRPNHRSPASMKRSAFSVYACEAFSDHVLQAKASAHEVLVLLDEFVKSNVLSWIQFIASTQNLTPLIRTAENLRKYLNTCAAKQSKYGNEMQTIRGWTTDLLRIAAKFGDALLTSPSAIYWLVLPLCPTRSTAYQTLKTGRGLSLVGLSNLQWDDRLSCIDFHEGKASAVAHGDEFFAVGLNTGLVVLYYGTSCQEYKTLDHGEAVKLLQFECKRGLIASCGLKTIRVWHTRTGEVIHVFQAPQRTLCLAFAEDCFMAASFGCYLATWDLDSGVKRQDRSWYDSAKTINKPARRSPCAISISMEHKMLAIAYRGSAITLWDLEEDFYYGSCGKKLPNGATGPYLVNALIFNPNPNIQLLAAAYNDSELVVLNPFEDHTLERLRVDSHVLAASPDGRILVGADGFGTIRVYEFNTLRLLHLIKTTGYIKQLAFSKDNFHFIDIRGSQCNVWEPLLIQDHGTDESGEAASVVFNQTEETHSGCTSRITAMTVHPSGEYAFCGKENGSVSLYDLHDGKQVQTLYYHSSHCLVRILMWWPNQAMLMSVDAGNTILAWNLKKQESKGLVSDTLVLRSRLSGMYAIIDVLAGHNSGKFIISTRESDHLWRIDGQEEEARSYSTPSRARKWIAHPQSALHMICIDGATALIYEWSTWKEVLSLSIDMKLAGLQANAVFSCSAEQKLLIDFSSQSSTHSKHHIYCFDSIPFERDPASKESVLTPSSEFHDLNRRVSNVIGISGGRVFFLDINSWIYSVDVENLSGLYLRHFFVPYGWFPSARDMLCAVTAHDHEKRIVFACGNEIAVIGKGLDYGEWVTITDL